MWKNARWNVPGVSVSILHIVMIPVVATADGNWSSYAGNAAAHHFSDLSQHRNPHHPPASPEFWQDAASMALIEVVIVNCVISPQGGKGPYAKHGVCPRSHEKLAQDRNLRD